LPPEDFVSVHLERKSSYDHQKDQDQMLYIHPLIEI
jgi:hypothetical protein